jgi:hypothetical protein
MMPPHMRDTSNEGHRTKGRMDGQGEGRDERMQRDHAQAAARERGLHERWTGIVSSPSKDCSAADGFQDVEVVLCLNSEVQ